MGSYKVSRISYVVMDSLKSCSGRVIKIKENMCWLKILFLLWSAFQLIRIINILHYIFLLDKLFQFLLWIIIKTTRNNNKQKSKSRNKTVFLDNVFGKFKTVIIMCFDWYWMGKNWKDFFRNFTALTWYKLQSPFVNDNLFLV